MSLTYEESSPRSTKVLYIRGIPYQCPGSGKGLQDAPAEPPAKRHRAETCANRLFARRLSGEENGAGLTRVEARVHAELMESRRALRRFTGRGVSMRELRRLVMTACAADSGKKGPQARFVVVESAQVMGRLGEMVLAWLRREGLGPDGPGATGDGGWTLFGGAPHVAVVHAPADVTGAPEACARAVARLEWLATGAGLGTCFAGEFVQAATADPAMAAALAVPSGHVVYAALLMGYPAVPDLPEQLPDTTILWL